MKMSIIKFSDAAGRFSSVGQGVGCQISILMDKENLPFKKFIQVYERLSEVTSRSFVLSSWGLLEVWRWLGLHCLMEILPL